MELHSELLESLRNQFFGNKMDTEDACERWSKALQCLNGSESVNHLWADKEFREAIYDAGRIQATFFENFKVGKEAPLKEFELKEIVEEIADLVDYGNSFSCWQKMLEGILTILPDTKLQKEFDFHSVEEFAHVAADIKALAAVTKAIRKVNEIQERLANEIKNITLGESLAVDEEKRKPLKKAA